MARNNLTSKTRSFRSNPRNFLNKITEAPLVLEVSDGLGGTVEVVVNTKTATVTNQDSLPSGLVTNIGRREPDTVLP